MEVRVAQSHIRGESFLVGCGYMLIRDLQGWHPSWAASYSGIGKFAIGEVGVLKRVRWSSQSQYLVLSIEYEGNEHSGVLQGNRDQLQRVLTVLTQNVGRPIKEVAALEVPS